MSAAMPGKTAAILHGRNCFPDMFWHPYAERLLRESGYDAWRPQLPNTAIAALHDWLPFVMERFIFTEETVLIGHSASCPLILSVLERLDRPIAKAILVAGSIGLLNSGEPRPILQERYDWERVRMNAKEIIVINSDDDPYGADAAAGKEISERAGGRLIIAHGQGHFGSIKYGQEYEEFPLLRALLR